MRFADMARTKMTNKFPGAGGTVVVSVSDPVEPPDIGHPWSPEDLAIFTQPALELIARSSTMRHAVRVTLSGKTARALAEAILRELDDKSKR